MTSSLTMVKYLYVEKITKKLNFVLHILENIYRLTCEDERSF